MEFKIFLEMESNFSKNNLTAFQSGTQRTESTRVCYNFVRDTCETMKKLRSQIVRKLVSHLETNV